MTYRFVLFVLSLHILFQAKAQEPFYYRLTTEDGLPSNCVYGISQDKDGYMWFATDNGVARFDGNYFKQYTQADGLTDNEFFFARPDSKGRMWFLPSNGLPCFLKDGKIYNPSNTSYLNKLKSVSWYSSFCEDAKGNIWIGTFLGQIFKLDSNNHVTRFYSPEDEKLNGYPFPRLISEITLDRHGNAWAVISEVGAICLTKDPYKIRIKSPPNFGLLASKAVFLDSNTVIYSILDGIAKSDSIGNYKQILHIKFNKTITHISKNLNNDLILGNELELYSITKDSSEEYTSDLFLKGTSLGSVSLDQEGNIWISTLNNGAYLVNSTKIKHFKNIFLKGETVTSLYRLNANTVIAGGENGKICFVNSKNMKPNSMLEKFAVAGRGRVRSILSAGEEYTALVFENRLALMKDEKLSVTLPVGAKSFLHFRNRFFIGTSNNFYVIDSVSLNEIFRSNEGNRMVNNIETPMDSYSALQGSRVLDMDGDYKGRVWLATNDGLFCYDVKSKSFNSEPRKFRLSTKPIQCIKVFKENIVFGIQGFGLGIYNSKGFFLVSSSKWVKGALIRRIVKISEKEFWLCTNNGLLLFTVFDDFRQFKIERYTSKDGLLSDDVNDIANDGKRWLVACNNGISIVPRDLIRPSNERPPLLAMAGMLINNSEVGAGSNLEFVEGNLQIDFSYSCLSFKHFRNLTFRYRLNLNDPWKIKRNFSQKLTNLSEGNYTIEVQAKSPGSRWGESLYFPSFTVLPPFWQRGWFLFLVVFASVGTTAFIIFAINKNRLEKASLDQQLTEANLKALRAQIKPHFIFNALNSVQHFFLENQKEEGLEFLGRFSLLMRRMLKGSDNQFHTLAEEIQLIEEYLEIEKDRIGELFNFRIEIDPEVDKEVVQIPTMLLQPIVENALWHGIMFRTDRSGIIDLEIVRKPTPKTGRSYERILVSITDNGAGRKSAEERKNKVRGSFGLRSIRQKLELLNKRYESQIEIAFEDLVDADNNALGTKVILDLPVVFRDA